MKNKSFIIILTIVFVLLVNCNVFADTGLYLGGDLQFSTDANDSKNYINKINVASGKKLEFKFEGSTSEFRWGTGDDAVLLSKQRPQKFIVKISSSNNVSCTINNLKNSVYTLSGNTFTLKDINIDSKSIEGKIGAIVCTLPSTNSFIKVSKDMYLNIALEVEDIDIASEPHKVQKSTKTFKYQLGVVNENYIKSLNDKSSIKSVTVDGKEANNSKIIDIDKASVLLKIEQNDLASKNKLTLSVNSDKKGEIIKDEKITYKEKTINLPYGGTAIQIEEETEKEIIIDGLKWVNDDRVDDYGFSSGTFNSNSKGGAYFLFNRVDNRSKVNTLKSLNITGVSISFKPDLKNYIANVPYKVSSININSILTDPKSSYVSGFGNRSVNLKEGLNTVLIKVKAENESVATYTIKITRDKNDDASLKSISVNEKEIGVKNDLLIYSTNVNNDVIKPTIKAIPNDSKAKVAIEKFNDLVEGSNEISITVTAANGTKKVYVIDIIRDKLISTNSKLKKLEIKNHEIDFDPEKNDYNVHINYDVEKLDLNIETDHEKAKYIVTGNKDLENESVIKIKVTAEDGITTTTYTINIEKEKRPFNILFVVIPSFIILVILLIIIILKKKKQQPKLEESPTESNNLQEENIPIKKDVH